MRADQTRYTALAKLLAVAAFTTGCTDDSTTFDEHDVELVGGTTTTARPEIGVFNNAAGGACTATLIGRQAILTAAHCLAPAYTATTVAAGAVFMFTDRNGASQTYAVDRVHSFATQRYEYQPDSRFTTDVAVLHLATPVPSTQATPATIAMQEPYGGESSTTFGFGCTDRTPQSGGGTKQYFSFNYGDTTRALCWGDSGGPVVFGAVNGNGNIWGVNSDFSSYVFSPDEMTDVFAGIPGYQKQIEDVVRGWDGIEEVGINRPGLDYAYLDGESGPGCRVACDNDAGCRAYTFVPSSAGSSLGRCWLKSGVSDPVPYPGATSGIARVIQPNSNRGGNDYAVVSASRDEQCAAACGRDLTCHAWTFVPPSGSAAGSCWLKGSVPAATTHYGVASGVQVRELEPNINRPGYDFAVLTASTSRACARKCAENERCEAFTFTPATSNNCFLKDTVPVATTGSGMVSGVRRGLETNIDRWGSDYRNFTTSRLSPTTCQAACARESQCQAWTYVPPVAPQTAATCFLKNQIPTKTAARGMVSGVKGMELLP